MAKSSLHSHHFEVSRKLQAEPLRKNRLMLGRAADTERRENAVVGGVRVTLILAKKVRNRGLVQPRRADGASPRYTSIQYLYLEILTGSGRIWRLGGVAESQPGNGDEFAEFQAGGGNVCAELRQVVFVGAAHLFEEAMDTKAL